MIKCSKAKKLLEFGIDESLIHIYWEVFSEIIDKENNGLTNILSKKKEYVS